ncbi:PREDICTED: mitogen-activated protein kinase kinase kinase 13-A-like [Amphimedon queenslandica]|uniref:Protein kinase domain-containing protein n=1 Tax=Amphimedon queenslandica TaxID=400682 RepID=A0A1X7UG88_AMPQE|nr:PREDICTED: mitogen-activated protein kinase kinase kinase 13-A-like [Amphimedon queenslandica]|eukprot:XP_003388129.1 PREDICTED: mitogen-activated protein kinase kinase kinase 13-A-like [Amphimedon queenslandica]
MEDIEEDPPRDPPLSDTDELQATAKVNADPSASSAGMGMELSEQESRIRDLLDGLSLTAGRSSTTEYKKKTLGVVQNLVNYLNPLGYFKKDQAGQAYSWEIPFEDIRELSYIGKGGQGAVFSGKYRDNEVAVKKVNDPKQTELKILRKLSHPNIVKCLGVCNKPPCYCIVMEYCRLGNLFDYIRKTSTKIMPFDVIQWSREICTGMQFLHSKKLIHRDLKSLNVLVSDNHSMKITDFGVSRTLDHQFTKMTVIGSVAWMAPELIRSEPCSEKVDIWSFGVCLWELLTREEPYKDLNHGAVIYGVGSTTLSLPIPTGCPSDLKSLLQKCWQQKPKSRPSFSQIIEELNVIALGEFLKFDYAEYIQMQDSWKTEISLCLDGLTKNLQFHSNSHDEVNRIAMMRDEELRHAREVREMYEKKLAIASELCDILAAKKEELEMLSNELQHRTNDIQHEAVDSVISSLPSSKPLSIPKGRRPSTVNSSATTSKVGSLSSLSPEILITETGDYSPAIKDFLSRLDDTKISLSKKSGHRRAHSFSGHSSDNI